MKTDTNKHVGKLGEHIAARYLTSKGFKVKGFNYLRPYGEIDIICTKERMTHFIEVKTVSREIKEDVTYENNAWNPAEKIGDHKLHRMVRTIDTYVQEKGIEGDWQMDAVLVELDSKTKKARVEYIENISPYT